MEGMSAGMNNGMGFMNNSIDSYRNDTSRGNFPPIYPPERYFKNAPSFE